MPPAPASAPAPPRRPIPEELKNVYLMMAIQEAPESTIRTVLRALCGDADYKARIMTLMFNKKLPLKPEATTTAAEASTSTSGSRKRKAPNTEICIQCDEPFEEGDKSVTCKHHLFDMELDEDDETWLEMPIFPEEIAETPFYRKENPQGFVFPCCGTKGSRSRVNRGCTMGRHRAADGNRTKYPGDIKESSTEEEDDDDDEETDKDSEYPEGRVERNEEDGIKNAEGYGK
ncbi:uncharacterized protein B0T23DRAFT_102829 [Neurospora hispaniola]|uniref:Uncharacterized protein n=1 Tax=Neurospora hispaniola TaxID=588809 RepID=A0AAJ0I8Y4_9PEZI|nr:hypothetical protein B0T23DRAFT_102829 [Neurospora hispaniola]